MTGRATQRGAAQPSRGNRSCSSVNRSVEQCVRGLVALTCRIVGAITMVAR